MKAEPLDVPDLNLGDCIECGGKLIWGGMSWEPHTEKYHAARRFLLIRTIGRRLREEAVYRAMAVDMAQQYGCVLVMWRLVLPNRIVYTTTQTAGDTWDIPEVRAELLTAIGRKLRDDCQDQFGIRPHPMQVKYRVFDERPR